MKQLNANWRRKISLGMKRAWRTSAKLKAELARRKTKKYKLMMHHIEKKAMNRPEVRRKLRGIWRNPEYRRKQRLARLKSWRRSGRRFFGIPHSRISYTENEVSRMLRKNGHAFQTQFEVPGTRYVADIFFSKKKVIVEIDGHDSHWKDERRMKHDAKRDRILRSLGYRVYHLGPGKLRGRGWRKESAAYIERVLNRLGNPEKGEIFS
jgi:very-short-patch-repair endonuclease